MKPSDAASLRRRVLSALLLGIVAAGALWAFDPKEPGAYLDFKEFFKPELYISSSQEPLEAIVDRLPNQAAWRGYMAAHEKAILGNPDLVMPNAYIDPRSGAATSLIGAFPLIPGRGFGNTLEMADLQKSLGRSVQKVDSAVVGDLVLAFIRNNAGLLGIDTSQFGCRPRHRGHPRAVAGEHPPELPRGSRSATGASRRRSTTATWC